MKRLITSLSSLLVGLTVADFAPANHRTTTLMNDRGGTSHVSRPNGGKHPDSSRNRQMDYHRRYGDKFSHGYYYRGRHHRHWSTTRWDKRYHCRLYYDRGLRCWYYWCPPDQNYYPVSYCPYGRYDWPDNVDDTDEANLGRGPEALPLAQ